jgi:FlaA1/EpsC-like NDP-sugar epimerase
MLSSMLSWPRATKRSVVVLLDICLALMSTWLAFSFRLDAPHIPGGVQWLVYVLAALLPLPFFVRLGLYRAIFRYTGPEALLATALAIMWHAVVLSAILLWMRWPGVPRSLGLLQPLLFLIFVAGSRFVARVWLTQIGAQGTSPEGRLMIYGAGPAGVQAANAIAVTGQYQVVGFLTDDPTMAGRSINGVRVDSSDRAAELVHALGVTDILLALTKASRTRRTEIVQQLRKLPVHVRTLPNWGDLASGRITAQDFRELDIEDLLGRDPIPPDDALLAKNLHGQVVLVTGAGGSIGSELCRQILGQQPSILILVDHSEYALYAVQQDLEQLMHQDDSNPAVKLVAVLANVTQAARVDDVFVAHRPHTVFHAAAYKHVPLVEANSGEGLLNNVFGTLHLARAAMRTGVAYFVLISTDKAVRPTNVMGASKRMAELVLQSLAAQKSGSWTAHEVLSGTTCFTMVRFGNVLGSSGSVVPLFRKQLAEGGPLTVTHPEVTRYFMTIPEAAQLVLQAGAMARGGDVFVLDMGEPVKIMDLARQMVELSGLTVRDASNPQGDIAIDVTGLRPGEKLYEELLIGDNPMPTSHPRIMKAHEDFIPWSQLQPVLAELEHAIAAQDRPAMMAVLRQCVQGFSQASHEVLSPA